MEIGSTSIIPPIIISPEVVVIELGHLVHTLTWTHHSVRINHIIVKHFVFNYFFFHFIQSLFMFVLDMFDDKLLSLEDLGYEQIITFSHEMHGQILSWKS